MTAFDESLIGRLFPKVSHEIAAALGSEYVRMESRFARGDWRPAELNGGRFAEAVLRYLEWRSTGGSFTPIGIQLNRQGILNAVLNNTSLPDGLRFHVSKCCEIMMDVRNKRDVAHLGHAISVDEMDARLVMRMASWTLAEIIREESGISPSNAQGIIDRLSSVSLPLVEEIGGDLIVLRTDLSAKEKALVVLYHRYPAPLDIGALRQATRYSNSTRFRSILREQAKEALVHVKDDSVFLTKKGIAWVEKNVDLRLEL